MRPTVIIGNWKMYKTVEETVKFLKEFAPTVQKADVTIGLAVPFTAIQAAAEEVKGSSILIGGQNMNDANDGAFTGEISVIMLKEAGAGFVILGHSERRHIFGEDDAFINRKVKRALEGKLQPILCIGETLTEREAKQTEEVLKRQLEESLADITVEQLKTLWIAYEPVWAIGTGKSASPDQAHDAHKFCRKVIEDKWGSDTAEAVVIQYGGSVKPENAKALLELTDIDGVLVGGASLSPESFSKIVHYQNIENYQTIK